MYIISQGAPFSVDRIFLDDNLCAEYYPDVDQVVVHDDDLTEEEIEKLIEELEKY